MSTRFMQSPAVALERIAYAVLAAAMGVGLLSIIVAGFRTALPEAIAGKAVAAQVVCEQPAAIGAIPGVQGPVAAVTR